MVLGNLGTMNILISATNTASDDINNVQRDMGSLAGAARKSGAALTAFGAAGAAAAGLATKNYADFEEQMIEVQKVTGMSNSEMNKLSDTIRELSAGPLPASATELGKIAAQAGSIGVEGTENIAQFTETVQKMAIATRLSSEEAAEQVARISNAFDIPTSKAEQMGSTINELSNNTSAWSDEISTGLRKAAPAANAAGASLQETSGIVATLVGNGMRAERAGTRLNRVFSEMSQKTEGMAEVMGITTAEMDQMVQENPTDALFQFVEAAKEAENTQKVLGETFGSSSAKVLNMIQNTDEVREKIKVANQAFKEGSSLQSEYEDASKGLNVQIQNLKDSIGEMGNAIGERVAPMLKNTVIPAVEGLTNTFNNMSDGMKDVVIGAGLVATGIALVAGPALMLIGFLPAIASGLSMVAGAAAMVSAPMLIAAGAVVALGAAIATNFMGIRDAITNALSAVWQYAKPVLNALIGAFQSFTAFVLSGVANQVEILGKLTQVVADVFGFILPVFKNAGASIITALFGVTNMLTFVMDKFTAFGNGLTDFLGGVVDWVVDQFENMANDVIGALNGMIESYNDLAEEVPLLSTIGTLEEVNLNLGGSGEFRGQDVGKEARDKMDKMRVDAARLVGGEGAAKAVKGFQNAIEGVPGAMNSAGEGMVKMADSMRSTSESLRTSEDATIGSLEKGIKNMMGGEEDPQTKKQGNAMLKQLKLMRKEQRKQRKTPQGQGGQTVIEEGAINVNESQNPDETSKAIFRGIKGRGGSVQ